MSELRWILLVAGLLLIAGIYLWGLRARRRSAAPDHERMARVEPARTVAVVAEPARLEPEVGLDDERAGQPAAISEQDYEEPAVLRAHGATRREPRLEPRFEEDVEAPASSPRHEPRLAPDSAAPAEAVLEWEPTQRVERPEPPRQAPVQRIVAVRVVAVPGTQFDGASLTEALAADGFVFGRYDIFHRLDADGRPVVSLASLKEPGTFDLERMADSQFRGVAMFAVMPGPLPGLQAFDELIIAARAMATHLGGHLQDERGAPLTVGRITQLREEIAARERVRGATGD